MMDGCFQDLLGVVKLVLILILLVPAEAGHPSQFEDDEPQDGSSRMRSLALTHICGQQ